jgi:hypothetical protein
MVDGIVLWLRRVNKVICRIACHGFLAFVVDHHIPCMFDKAIPRAEGETPVKMHVLQLIAFDEAQVYVRSFAVSTPVLISLVAGKVVAVLIWAPQILDQFVE